MKSLEEKPRKQRKDYVTIGVRVPRTLKMRLSRIAEEEKRDLSKQVLFFLEKGVLHQDKLFFSNNKKI